MKTNLESLLLALVVLSLVFSTSLDHFAEQSDTAGFVSGVMIGLSIVASGVYIVLLAGKSRAARKS